MQVFSDILTYKLIKYLFCIFDDDDDDNILLTNIDLLTYHFTNAVCSISLRKVCLHVFMSFQTYLHMQAYTVTQISVSYLPDLAFEK